MLSKFKKIVEPESIAVGFVPSACQPYVFWWLPLGASTCRRVGGRSSSEQV